jgi:HAD superfamily phosphoserine phosphatase-like hydrolase
MEIIVCDFDGTITNRDFLSHVFDMYCPAKKAETEELHSKGIITHQEQINACLQCVRGATLEELVEKCGVRVDPFFKEWYRSLKTPFYIVSAGLRPVIKNLLDYVDDSEIYANEIDVEQWRVVTNICKIEIVQALRKKHPGHKIVYYGDGTSDFKVSHIVDDLRVKKGTSLERYAIKCNLEYTPFAYFPPCTKRIVHIGCGRLFMGFIEPYFRNTERIFHVRSDKNIFGTILDSEPCFMGSLEELLVILHGSEVLFTVSVGVQSFSQVYSQIHTAFPRAHILAFENHLLYTLSTLENVHVCFADKICSSIHKTIDGDRVSVRVTTEPYEGQLLLPTTCRDVLVDTDRFTFVDDITRRGLQKKMSTNTIQFILSFFEGVTPCVLRLLALACIHMKKELGMTMSEAVSVYACTMERLRHVKDSPVRIQRNLHSKLDLIKFLC